MPQKGVKKMGIGREKAQDSQKGRGSKPRIDAN
jgi:hypothetical protein